MDQLHANSFLGKYYETKMGEGAWELSVAHKSETVLPRALHQDISLTIVFFFFPQTNLAFNLVLIE